MAVKEKNKFDKWNEWLTNVEGSLVNLASTIVPWLTPISPMVMTFNHAVEIFGGGTWGIVWATPVAATVELLGFVTVSTMIRFWMNNQKKNLAAYKKAPTWVAGLMFLFYLGLVLSTNVLLDLGPVIGVQKEYVEIVVKALFTLQTIPGAVIVAVRFAHRELLEGTSIFNPISTSTVPVSPTQASTSSSTSTKKPKSGTKRKSAKDAVYAFIIEWKKQHSTVPTFSDVIAGTKLPDSTVSRWRNQWITENPQP